MDQVRDNVGSTLCDAHAYEVSIALARR